MAKKQVNARPITSAADMDEYQVLSAQIKALETQAAELKDQRDALKAGIIQAAGKVDPVETKSGSFKYSLELFGYFVTVTQFERDAYEVPAATIERVTVK